ncbi:hypothetical protein HY485_04430 [Candidatus Woesearchaeota archaeon]|nr:hypothetical protein [Candidatus Woesearchaeota archaeon]
MDKKVWREQIAKSEQRIYEGLVAKVVGEESLLQSALSPLSTSLGKRLLNSLWTVYMNARVGLQDRICLYFLEKGGFVKFDGAYKMTEQGEATFKEYFSEVLMKNAQGPNWEEECARRIKDMDEAMKYEGHDYLNTRCKILMAQGLKGLEAYFAEVEKKKREDKPQ